LAADEHAWRRAIRVLASIAQCEASSLTTAVERAARVGVLDRGSVLGGATLDHEGNGISDAIRS
jgi:hypothetical protein